jgi:hypothetical protein
MKLWFLPFIREGVAPTVAAGARAQARLGLRLSAPGRTVRDIARTVELLGPGDVIGIESAQILRVAPAAASTNAEPDFFPLIEFDAPDLAWAYSPLMPEGARLLPWIALVVVEAQPGVRLDPGERGQSRLILRMPPDVARRELPDLTDSWAWVHAQVACDAAAQIPEVLATQPDRTLGRLLSPRRLQPNRQYHACVVPTFLTGRIAGLGGNPATDPAVRTGHEPAWSAAGFPDALPVYFAWTFRTGAAGDFEALAQRLRPTPLDASLPLPDLGIGTPAGLVVDWEAPLRVAGSTSRRSRRPAAAVAEIRKALKGGTATAPVLGPSYFGASWLAERNLDPLTAWAPELNLTPMWRAAAGLGAEAVRIEQESLVAAAQEQFEAFRATQREGRRKQLAAAVVNRVKLRLAKAPTAESARVFAPLYARTQNAAVAAGLYSVAGRRMVRKTCRAGLVSPFAGVGGALPTATTRPLAATINATAVTAATTATVTTVAAAELPNFTAEMVYRPAVTAVPIQIGALPLAPVEPATIPQGAFAPRFPRPMSEPLAERYPELMLPGLGAVPGDGVLLVESDPGFVEAFLVGANQELNHELLWRGLPSDSRATAFRRFWAHADNGDDIDAITTWPATGAVGSHVREAAAMVLLVRGELVRRYPTLLIAAMPALWNADRSARSPATDPATMVLPAFRGRIGEDVLYAGFPAPTLADAVGTPPAGGVAGWYLLLSENPGDPRFGLDPDAAGAPPTRMNLSWTHLNLDANANYARLAAFPNVADAGFVAATATAANLANLLRQRSFRVFLHASLLVRPKA